MAITLSPMRCCEKPINKLDGVIAVILDFVGTTILSLGYEEENSLEQKTRGLLRLLLNLWEGSEAMAEAILLDKMFKPQADR